jgi:hypothetical protein
MKLCELPYLGLLLKCVNIPVLVKVGRNKECTYFSDLMKLVFTIVLRDTCVDTGAKETMFIIETSFLFCGAQAEAEETVEHRA